VRGYREERRLRAVIANERALMTAHPLHEDNPDDPVEILRILPEEYHAQFLADYEDAVRSARRPEQFRALQELLRLWRLRAVAYSSPGYGDRLAAAREGKPADFAPAARVARGWPGE
jgi:hypothetical protein